MAQKSSKKAYKKLAKKFPKKIVAFVTVIILVGVGLYIYVLNSHASSWTYHNSVTWTTAKYGSDKIPIPGAVKSNGTYVNSRLTGAGITTFGGPCDGADNGISGLSGKKLSTYGPDYAALRLGDDKGTNTNDTKLINDWVKSKGGFQTLRRQFMNNLPIYIRRQVGKDKKGNPIYKEAWAHLADWGPSSSVVSKMKSGISKKKDSIATVIDVSPDVAAQLGFPKDTLCKDKNGKVIKDGSGKAVYTAQLGWSDLNKVSIGFWAP